MCHKSYFLWDYWYFSRDQLVFIRRDFSLYQHKEAIRINIEFEEFSIFFFLKVLCFFQHLPIIYGLCNITL